MTPSPEQPDIDDGRLLEEVVGYLNFSSGASDPRFLRNIDLLVRRLARPDENPVDKLCVALYTRLDQLESSEGAFADVAQARASISLLAELLLPAYRAFHHDLLHHQGDAELWRPFFLGRAWEAILQQGPPWTETSRVINGALTRLNDYVGYRPTATLSSGSQSEPYAHEFVRAIPLYIRGAGVSTGRYERLTAQALEILRATDPEILARAWFDPDHLEEIALDPRAYDFDHPVNRRPNYHFGLWDPYMLDDSHNYSRFVLQQITLDALLTRCEEPHLSPAEREQYYFEAAAVLAGTILMASGTCGDGPGRHDSSVTLSSLLPHIASYRDEFYRDLLARTDGPHGARLRQEAMRCRQPLGGARQHLNHELARRRALQIQRVHLALLFARMGRPALALAQADSVRVASARMLTAIYCRLTAAHDAIDRGELAAVADVLEQIEDLVHRAIECGALVDPWNIVGFAANFSLFPALENTVHDWRVDELIELVEQILDLAARAWSESAAVDDQALEVRVSAILNRLSHWWDRYASSSVSGVKRLVAQEIQVSANLVAGALNAWHKAGAAAGDIGFWRMFVDQFDTSKAFQLVVEALLDHGDAIASRALLMQWVNQRDRTPLSEGDSAFHPLAFRWLATVESQQRSNGIDGWPEVARFFAYLEANAEEFWEAPLLSRDLPGLDTMLREGDSRLETDSPRQAGAGFSSSRLTDDDEGVGIYEDDDEEDDDEDDGDYDYDYDYDDLDEMLDDDVDDDDLEEGPLFDEQLEASLDDAGGYRNDEDTFEAAYEEMVYRDSTDDGQEGDVFEHKQQGLLSVWENEARRLDQRLRFLKTVARMWRHVAIAWGGRASPLPDESKSLHDADPRQPEHSVVAPLPSDQPLAPDPQIARDAVFGQWLTRASANYQQLLELAESMHRRRIPPPEGSRESLIEFDRLRSLKDAMMQNIVATCVETSAAARLLLASLRKSPSNTQAIDPLVDQAAVDLLRAVLGGDPDQVRSLWDGFLVALRPRQMLYLPHFRGGQPRKTVATRVLQRLVHDLLGWLPRLGLLRETCQLLDLAQQMESDHPVGPGAVTEFDRLFESGYQAVVRCVVAAAEAYDERASAKDEGQSDNLLVDALQQLTERQLERWLAHSRTLRLSVVEKLSESAQWERFLEFVQEFGAELFTQNFLGSRGNLRGILHQGVSQWIAQLEGDEDAWEAYPFIEAMNASHGHAKWSRDEVVEILAIAIEAVDENYAAYRDYNTTTTQSDHGELLYQFVDFLRLRAAYDRVAWNLKPVVWAHEILVRHGRHHAAEMWRQAFTERTCDAADAHLARLEQLSEEYGMQLPSVSERLHERFVRPLIIDRLRALVEPAMGAKDDLVRQQAVDALQRDIDDLADLPQGAGLDVPDWLAALEEEVTEARSRLHHVSALDQLDRRVAQATLDFAEIFEQLSDPDR